MVKAFRNGRWDAVLPSGHAVADHFVQERAVRGGLVQDAPEIWMAGQPAWRWLKVSALREDLLAHQVAMDSNSV